MRLSPASDGRRGEERDFVKSMALGVSSCVQGSHVQRESTIFKLTWAEVTILNVHLISGKFLIDHEQMYSTEVIRE